MKQVFPWLMSPGGRLASFSSSSRLRFASTADPESLTGLRRTRRLDVGRGVNQFELCFFFHVSIQSWCLHVSGVFTSLCLYPPLIFILGAS